MLPCQDYKTKTAFVKKLFLKREVRERVQASSIRELLAFAREGVDDRALLLRGGGADGSINALEELGEGPHQVDGDRPAVLLTETEQLGQPLRVGDADLRASNHDLVDLDDRLADVPAQERLHPGSGPPLLDNLQECVDATDGLLREFFVMAGRDFEFPDPPDQHLEDAQSVVRRGRLQGPAVFVEADAAVVRGETEAVGGSGFDEAVHLARQLGNSCLRDAVLRTPALEKREERRQLTPELDGLLGDRPAIPREHQVLVVFPAQRHGHVEARRAEQFAPRVDEALQEEVERQEEPAEERPPQPQRQLRGFHVRQCLTVEGRREALLQEFFELHRPSNDVAEGGGLGDDAQIVVIAKANPDDESAPAVVEANQDCVEREERGDAHGTPPYVVWRPGWR